MSSGEATETGKTAVNGAFLFSKLGDSYHFEIDNHLVPDEILDFDKALWITTTAPGRKITIQNQN